MASGSEIGSTANSVYRYRPYTSILIQPAESAHRFRYISEGPGGSLIGVNNTPDNNTYPTIQVVNCKGEARVVVSCVTKDQPYRPHPHRLTGRGCCQNGICQLSINNDGMICSFSNLGIQCVTKKGIKEALQERQAMKVDPFGNAHMIQPTNHIDLNTVRLCFQVFLKNEVDGKFTIPLPPVVSDPIINKRTIDELVICRLCPCSASMKGGVDVILLCRKINKDDIKVRFYEVKDGQNVWHDYGQFGPHDVHSQVAIALKTPEYCNMKLLHPVNAYVQLQKPSNGETSEPRPFQFLPVSSELEEDYLERQRKKARTLFDLYIMDNTKSVSVTKGCTTTSDPQPQQTVNISPPLPPPNALQVPFQEITSNYQFSNADLTSAFSSHPGPSAACGGAPGPSKVNAHSMLQSESSLKHVLTPSNNWTWNSSTSPEVPNVLDAFLSDEQHGNSSVYADLDLESLDHIMESHLNDPVLCLDVDNSSAVQNSFIDFFSSLE